AACVAGVGLKKDQHVKAAQAAAALADCLKRLLPSKRPAEVLGSDKVAAVAKALVTLRSLSPAPPPRLEKPLSRLADILALAPLLEKTQPDPALAARIVKAKPGTQPQQEKKGKGKKEGGKEEEVKVDGKAVVKVKGGKEEEKGKKEKKDKKEEDKAGKKRKVEEEEEESGSDEEEEEEGASASDDDEAGISSDDGDEEEEEESDGEDVKQKQQG
ncbi:hypothetical protein Agub_g13365, partial [Astrephomene gubernaculifera]